MMVGLQLSHHRTRIATGILDYFYVWAEFLVSFNRVYFEREDLKVEVKLWVILDMPWSLVHGKMIW